MRLTDRALHDSGLPACWAHLYEALRPAPALHRAVRHTTEPEPDARRLPLGHGGRAAAVPVGVLRRHPPQPHTASAEDARRALARLRTWPGYGELLRATTALALYGALDGGVVRPAPRAREVVR
ncbi:hypothetical protein O1M54_22545 [Streptomyces diastatochromogenes]|nr:hypothetical protein [Streptomyces diastatochromogenes]